MADPGVQAFQNYWRGLPANYVPEYDFAMLENGPQGTGTYAFPASPYRQQQFRSRFTHEPVWGAPPDVGVPDDAVLLGGYYGATPIDPKYALDLDIWNKGIQAGNATDDEFRGFVANVFGNAYTLPALFAGGAMGANAYVAGGAAGGAGAGAGEGGGALAGGSGSTALGGTGGETLASALAPEFEGGTFGATGASTFSTATPGLVAQASPYITGTSYGLKGLGAVTDNKQLSQAGSALGIVGSAAGAGGGNVAEDFGSFRDWASLAGTAAALGSTIYGATTTANAIGNQTDVAQQQTDLAKQLFGETAPLRGLTNAQLMQLLITGRLPAAVQAANPNLYGLQQFMETGELPPAMALAPTTAANRDVLESQYGRARESAISRTPRGGQLNAALTDLEGQRAAGVTGLYANENAQRNRLAQSLYGTGLDFTIGQQKQDADLRRALFASAIGAGGAGANLGLTGLANAGQQYGNVASTALKGTDLGLDTLATLFYGRARRQPTGRTGNPYNLDEFSGQPQTLDVYG